MQDLLQPTLFPVFLGDFPSFWPDVQGNHGMVWVIPAPLPEVALEV